MQIIDMRDVGAGCALGEGLAALRAIMTAAHQYPQRLHRTLLLHPPPFVSLAWGMLCRVLPPPVGC